jgi:hypothetical protein
MINVERYTPPLLAQWDQFVEESKNGTFLFKRAYMDYHADRFNDISLICRFKDRIIAVLPANINEATVHSHQGLSYGGFVVGSDMTTPLMGEVFTAVLQWLRDSGAAKLVYKTVPHIYHRQPAEEDRFVLSQLGASLCRRDVLSVIDNATTPKVQSRRRRGARRAENAGLQISETGDFDAFWRILAQRLKVAHQVRPTHAAAEIALLKKRFPSAIRLFVGSQDATAMAGVLMFETERVAHVQYMAASDEGLKTGALDLLLFHLVEGVFRSKRYFDFGHSNIPGSGELNLGLIEQKEGFGARTSVQDHYELALVGRT